MESSDHDNCESITKKLKLAHDQNESKEIGEIEGHDLIVTNDLEAKREITNTHVKFLSPLLKLFFDSRVKSETNGNKHPKRVKDEFNKYYSNASTQKVYPSESDTTNNYVHKLVNYPPTYKIKLYSNKSNDPKLNDSKQTDSRCDYIVDQLYLLIEAASNKDINSMDFILKDIFLQDCTFKTPALKEPLIGRHHIIQMFRSIYRVCEDFKMEVKSHDKTNVNGTTVITLQHVIIGSLLIILEKHIYLNF